MQRRVCLLSKQSDFPGFINIGYNTDIFFAECRIQKYKSHIKYINGETYLGSIFDPLPGFGHFCRPVNVIYHQYTVWMAISQYLLKILYGAVIAMITIQVCNIHTTQTLKRKV